MQGICHLSWEIEFSPKTEHAAGGGELIGYTQHHTAPLETGPGERLLRADPTRPDTCVPVRNSLRHRGSDHHVYDLIEQVSMI
jgi:hypothetical protein